MTVMIRCEECGKQVEYDEETDAPVMHLCNGHDEDLDTLPELNFDE